MTESEKAEQDVAAARVVERIAEWKAMEAKASYYHYASKAMEASAEVMGARIRRDNAIAAEFADKAFALAETPAPTEVRKQDEQDAAGEGTRVSYSYLAGAHAKKSGMPRDGLTEKGIAEYDHAEWLRGWDDQLPPPAQEAPAIPEGGEAEHDQPPLSQEAYEALPMFEGIIDAEPSPILRSEVPPAAETYLAPSGDEFATVNGQTHLIVSDEAEAQGQAQTQPDAAYAPIHNEDDPPTNPVADDFAKGLLMESQAKAEHKRFGIFGIEFGGKKTLVEEGV